MKRDKIFSVKSFIKKSSINLCSSKSDFFFNDSALTSILSNRLTIKTDLYIFLKNLQLIKFYPVSKINENQLTDFGLRLQVSKLYSSFSEKERQQLVYLLKAFVKKRLVLCSFFSTKSLLNLSTRSRKKRLTSNKKGLIKLKGFLNYTKTFSCTKRQQFPYILNKKKFYFRLVKSRFSLFLKDSKKRYQTLKETSKLLFPLSSFFIRKFRYFNKKKEKRHRNFRKLLWRIKKRKKRKNRFLKGRVRHLFGRLYPRRFRFHYRFYVPRFLEINYKTYSFLRLNHFDKYNVDSKLPFLFNIRKLLTFTSF